MPFISRTIVHQRPSFKRRLAGAALRGTAVMTYRTTRWSVKRAYTYRRNLAPIYAAAMVAGTAAILSHAVNGVPTTVTIAGAAALGVEYKLRRRKSSLTKIFNRADTPSTRKAVYAWLTWALTSAWATWATAVGVTDVPARSTGGVLAATAAGFWWWHHRIRAEVEPEIPEQLLIWDEYVAGSNGPLAGAALAKLTIVDDRNWSADILLRRGKQTTKHAIDAAGAIASAYGEADNAVLIEPAADRRNDTARLMISNNNPTHAEHHFDESWMGLEKGTFKFHVYPDGQIGRLRLYQPMSGPKAVLFSSDTATGKTRGMELHVDQSAASGLVVPMFGEIQEGQGLPSWCGEGNPARYVATGDEEIVDYLHGIEAAMDARSKYLGSRKWVDEDGITRRGLDFYDPHVVPEMPMLGFYLPEAQSLLKGNEYVANLVTRIALKMRKTGIYFGFDTQYPDTTELGGSMALRSQLVSANIVCYRNSAKTTSGMILPSDMPPPHEIDLVLPNGESSAGTAIIYASAPGSTRRTYSRSIFVKKAHYYAEIAAAKVPELDDLTAEAFGNKITARKTQRAEDAAAAEQAKQQDIPGSRETITVAAPLPKPVQLPANATTIQRADAFLRSHPAGRATTGTIADAIDATLSAVSTALRREERRENPRIFQPRPGVWATTGVSREMEQVA